MFWPMGGALSRWVDSYKAAAPLIKPSGPGLKTWPWRVGSGPPLAHLLPHFMGGFLSMMAILASSTNAVRVEHRADLMPGSRECF